MESDGYFKYSCTNITIERLPQQLIKLRFMLIKEGCFTYLTLLRL